MLMVSWGWLLCRESEALKDSLSESSALQQDLKGGLYKPPLLVTQWTTPPHYLSRLWIKVWGLHIKQSWAFDVQRNTNTDLTRVVTAYLSPLVIHSLLVECLSLQRLLSVGLAYSSHAALSGLWPTMSRVWKEAIWLLARFDIDLLVVHVKIGGHQLLGALVHLALASFYN